MNQDQAGSLCGQVDQAFLMGDMRVFAQRTKLSGTAEELESFRYLQQRMAGLGFRTELLSHDALISLPGRARVEIDWNEAPSITHSFSRPSPPDGVRGPLIHVGAGDAVGFRGKDVRGAIVLAEGIASPEVADRASRGGALGQLHISPHEHLHEMCISPVWGSPSQQRLADLPITVAATVSHADGMALCRRLEAGEAPDVVLHAEVDTGWRKTPLLVAELDGPDPDGEFILLSGHHDTWFQGVMDNGGANATMIEVARLCASAQRGWRRGLRVCFWSGHSHGRYSGSAWYADHCWDELNRRCAAHVNVDSTGGIGASVLTNSGVASELAALAAEAVQAETGQRHAGRRMGRNADQSFWAIGIPSMFGSLSHQPPGPVGMRNPLGWWWHTPHDLLDKIDPQNLVRDSRIVLRVVSRLLNEAALPIDHTAQVDALLAELASLSRELDGRLPMQPLLDAAQALRQAAAALPRDSVGANRALMRACRALVPMDYTTGDRFDPDPALPLPAWPVLQPLRALAASTPGSDAAQAAMVGAVRARNRVLLGLQQANEALLEAQT